MNNGATKYITNQNYEHVFRLKTLFSFEPETYVLSNISRQRRSLSAQVKFGILPMKIETGRFRSLSVDQRICELCEMQKVENEIHFVCECPLYNDFREPLYEHSKLVRNDFTTMECKENVCFD